MKFLAHEAKFDFNKMVYTGNNYIQFCVTLLGIPFLRNDMEPVVIEQIMAATNQESVDDDVPILKDHNLIFVQAQMYC